MMHFCCFFFRFVGGGFVFVGGFFLLIFFFLIIASSVSLLSSTSLSSKWNSICLEIPFDRSSSLMETSQLISIANRLTCFFVIHEVRGFCMISGWGVFRWLHGFCRFLGELPISLQRLSIFDREFSRQGFG